MTNDLAVRILNGDVLGTTEQTHEAVAMAIKALSADVQPVRHGRWEWIASTAVEQHGTWLPYLKEGLTVKCSECGIRFDRPWHYCPACGATMDGESRMNLREVKLWQI